MPLMRPPRAYAYTRRYAPIIGYKDGWSDTLSWFRAHWLPTFSTKADLIGLSTSTQAKIDIQAAGTKKED